MPRGCLHCYAMIPKCRLGGKSRAHIPMQSILLKIIDNPRRYNIMERLFEVRSNTSNTLPSFVLKPMNWLFLTLPQIEVLSSKGTAVVRCNTSYISYTSFWKKSTKKKACITHITAPDGLTGQENGMGFPFSSWAWLISKSVNINAAVRWMFDSAMWLPGQTLQSIKIYQHLFLFRSFSSVVRTSFQTQRWHLQGF